MLGADELFHVGAELFLENFREVTLFEGQLLDNVKSRNVFDFATSYVTESLVAITSKSIVLGERAILGKLTMSMAKSPTKIKQMYDMKHVIQCRHKEGPGGWMEIVFRTGIKLRVIMESRQTECVALIAKHSGIEGGGGGGGGGQQQQQQQQQGGGNDNPQYPHPGGNNNPQQQTRRESTGRESEDTNDMTALMSSFREGEESGMRSSASGGAGADEAQADPQAEIKAMMEEYSS
jgi:hypothetical protein